MLTRLLSKSIAVILLIVLVGCEMDNEPAKVLPRSVELPLFDPHIRTFTCSVEVDKAPPMDAEADAWFREARALEDPEIFVEDRDYGRIVALTRNAAERRHWKAMLNLASLYLEGRDSAHGEKDALRLVEDAMRLGVPAAYDRMGTFYMNGTGLPADATKAYAFWQRAAQMGNPDSMAYLASKMVAVRDKPDEGIWSNIPIAVKMLECALGQGYGPAGFQLALEYTAGLGRPVTDDEKAKALKALHEGARFGCELCANRLYIEFDHPESLATMLPPFIDKARAERYSLLGDALGFNPFLRFPNIDSVLPLPPAQLPPWNGDKDTLIEAAMGAKLPPRPVPSAPAPQKDGRSALDEAFRLRPSGDRTEQGRAPFAGYWTPVAPTLKDEIQQALKRIPPGRYATGEAFEIPYLGPELGSPSRAGLIWEHWLTVDHDEDEVHPHAVAGLTREVDRHDPLEACAATRACPATGIWQPWVDRRHPLRHTVNVYWRQAWVLEGEPFPHPQRDWMLDLSPELVTWHLMDRGIDIGADLAAAESGT